MEPSEQFKNEIKSVFQRWKHECGFKEIDVEECIQKAVDEFNFFDDGDVEFEEEE